MIKKSLSCLLAVSNKATSQTTRGEQIVDRVISGLIVVSLARLVGLL